MKYKIKNVFKKQAYIKLCNKIYIQPSSFKSSEHSLLESSEDSSFETLNDSLDKFQFANVGGETIKFKTSSGNLSFCKLFSKSIDNRVRCY